MISFLFALGIALLPFGAVYWSEALGTLSASPGLLPIMLATLLAPLFRPRYLPIFRRLRLKMLLLAPIIGSVLSLAVFGWNPLYASKFFSVGLLSLIWLSPVLLIDYLKIRHLRHAVIFGITISLIGYITSDLFQALPDTVRNVVFGEAYVQSRDGRPRGFSQEASHFSAALSRLVIIYYLIYESQRPYNRIRLIAFLLGLGVFLAALGSKGAVVGIAIALISFTMRLRHVHYLLLILPVVWWLIATQSSAFFADIEQFSSTATRVTLLLTGMVATFANPLGWGYYGFYGAIQEFGTWSLEFINIRFPVFLLFEARDIIENLNAVSTKSSLIDFAMTFGWIFVFLMVKVVVLVQFNDNRVRACWVYVAITSLSTGGNLSILFFLTLAVMLRLYPRVSQK
jgi:hypothetical protein